MSERQSRFTLSTALIPVSYLPCRFVEIYSSFSILDVDSSSSTSADDKGSLFDLQPSAWKLQLPYICLPAPSPEDTERPADERQRSLTIDARLFNLETPNLVNLQHLALWNIPSDQYLSPPRSKIHLPCLIDLEIINSNVAQAELVNSLEMPVLDRLVITFIEASRTYFPTSHPDLHRVTRLRIEGWWSGRPGVWDDLCYAETRQNLVRLRDFLDLMIGVEVMYLEGRDVHLPEVIWLFDRTDCIGDPGCVRRLSRLEVLEFAQSEEQFNEEFDGDERVFLRQTVYDVAESRCMTLQGGGATEGILLVPECWNVEE